MTWDTQDLNHQGISSVAIGLPTAFPLDAEGEVVRPDDDALPTLLLAEQMQDEPPPVLGPRPVPQAVRRDMAACGLVSDAEWQRWARWCRRGIIEE
jgi:hypothetical protein